MITSFDRRLPSGHVLNGKWNRNRYEVVRRLGSGANGAVFLVRREKTEFALKIGFDAVDHQSEINVLADLSGREGAFSGYLKDVDDVLLEGETYPFYVMKYVRGVSLRDYVRLKGADWLSLAGLRLLSRLNELHKQGWIFGDLKADNVLVSGYGEAELVDYGGVTAKGRAVRQFTEIHDRAYWHAGSRTADEGYDLFSFAVLCLQLAAPDAACFSSRMLPQNRIVEVLLEEVRLQPGCRPYRDFLRKALLGQFPSSELALQAWRDAVYGIKEKPAGVVRSSRWLHAGFAASLGIGLWAFYLYLT